MANLVVLDIKGAPKSLTGHLQRIMLEIRLGTFVWQLSSRKTSQIWAEVKGHKCVAICVSAAKTETGFVVASHGKDARLVCDNFGVALISYKSKNSVKKSAEIVDPKIFI